MYKKIIALVLAMLMVLSLCACGSGKSKNEQSENEFALGTINGQKYENSFIGIGCKLPVEWDVLTQEEIKKQNEQALNLIGSDYAEAIQKAAVIDDFFATHSNQMDTIGVNMEKLEGPAALLTEEAYAKVGMDGLKSALESMGITNLKVSVETIAFAGEEHACICVTGEYMDVAIYEKVVCVKADGYIANVTACSWITNTCDDILSYFFAV